MWQNRRTIALNLTSVSFENFRSFKDKTEIPLTRITYLIGPNGAGKSNVFKGIDMMKNIITRDKLDFKKEDHFDQNLDAPAYLSFTAMLPADVRSTLLEKETTHDRKDVDFNTTKMFQYVKYEVSSMQNAKYREQISLSDADGKFNVVCYLHLNGNSYQLGLRRLATVNSDIAHNRNFETQDTPLMSTSGLVQRFDRGLHTALVNIWSSLARVPNTKKSPPAVGAAEATSVSYDGNDLPNELRTLDNDRSKTRELEKRLKHISSDEIVGIAVPIRGSSHVTTVTEKGLENKVTWDMLSIGMQNMIIISYILYRADKNIIMIEEPEIHLHAKAQKNLLKHLRKMPHDKQLVLETHSPIFANITRDESVILLVRDNGVTGAVQVNASNCNLLRREMGITHADAVGNDHLCIVEGESEHIAIPEFAKTMGYETGLAQWTWSLGGCGNTKNIGTFLQYVKTEGRAIFLLLDKNSEARVHVDKLVGKKLLCDNQYHFLEGNFEDLFPHDMLIEHTRDLAKAEGVEFTMSAQDLDAATQDRSAADVLSEEWTKLTDQKYPKADMAGRLATMSEDEIPSKVADVVRLVMDGLGIPGPPQDGGSG